MRKRGTPFKVAIKRRVNKILFLLRGSLDNLIDLKTGCLLQGNFTNKYKSLHNKRRFNKRRLIIKGFVIKEVSKVFSNNWACPFNMAI